MNYFKVKWKHEYDNEPSLIYCEVDEEQWETRKIEIYRDGRISIADKSREIGGAGLALRQTPPLTEIGADPQFEPVEISAVEFEDTWVNAIRYLGL